MTKRHLIPFVFAVLAVVPWCLSPVTAAAIPSDDKPDAPEKRPDEGQKPKTLLSATSSPVKSGPEGSSPVIHFPEPVHDFGTIARGSNVTHIFKVQNTGDAPLQLIKAKGS